MNEEDRQKFASLSEEMELKQTKLDKLSNKKEIMKTKENQDPNLCEETIKKKVKLEKKGTVKEVLKPINKNYKKLSKEKESLLKNKKNFKKHKLVINKEGNKVRPIKSAGPVDCTKTCSNIFDLKCVVCSKMLCYSVDNPPCVLALMSRTNIMGKRIKTKRPGHAYLKQDTYAYSYNILNSFLTFDNPDSSWYDSLWIQTCGHSIHYNCYFILMNSVLSENGQPKHKNEFEKYTQSEILTKKFFTRNFSCPDCLQLANTIFLMPTTSLLNTSISFAPPIYSLILTCLTESSRTYLEDSHRLLTNHYLNTTNMQNTHYSVFANILRNNIEIELMHKELLKQESSNFSSSLNFTPCKKIHTGVLYNYCSKIIRTNPANTIAKMLRLFDPEADDNHNFQQKHITLLDLKTVLTITVLFLPQPSNSVMRSIICFFNNLYLIQLLFWMVLFGDKKEILKWIDKNNLSVTQLEFIINELFNQLKFYRFPPYPGKDISIHETCTSKAGDFLKYSVLLYQAVVQPLEPFIEDMAVMKLQDLYKIIVPEEEILDDVASIKCYGWDDETVIIYISKFVKNAEFFYKNKLDFEMVRGIMLSNWKPPKFFNLPEELDMSLLHKYYINTANGKRTKFLAVCLSCSKFFKLPKHYTNHVQRKCAVMKIKNHSSNCGRGTSVFLMMPSKKALICWQKKFFIWDQLYDGDNNKKTLLRLHEGRAHFLKKMWLFNHFDLFCEPID